MGLRSLISKIKSHGNNRDLKDLDLKIKQIDIQDQKCKVIPYDDKYCKVCIKLEEHEAQIKELNIKIREHETKLKEYEAQIKELNINVRENAAKLKEHDIAIADIRRIRAESTCHENLSNGQTYADFENSIIFSENAWWDKYLEIEDSELDDKLKLAMKKYKGFANSIIFSKDGKEE